MPQSIQPIETIWLHKVAEIASMDSQNGTVLIVTMANETQYAIPIWNEQIRDAIHRITSPFTIADKLPTNGSGAS